MTPQVKPILDRCGLEGLAEDTNGWRAFTPFAPAPDAKKSLSVSKDGAWHCFRSERKGFIHELYAQCRGRSVSRARMELIQDGLLERLYDPKPREPEEAQIEKHDTRKRLEIVFEDLKCDNVNWDEVAKWRGIPARVFDDLGCDAVRTFAWSASGAEGMGSCYAFISTTPWSDDGGHQLRSIMWRSTVPEQSGWRTTGKYPIWVPAWNNEASRVWIVEGQWDAIALRAATLALPDDQRAKLQIMAICGGKNIQDYPEIMEYFCGKEVVLTPDNDAKGEELLAAATRALVQTDARTLLLRIPKPKRGACKDFNDWFREGIKVNEFSEWIECAEAYRESNGVIVDSEFCEKHKVPLDGLYEVDGDGKPVQVMSKAMAPQDALDKRQVLDLLRPFPLLYEYVEAHAALNEAPAIWHLMSFLVHFAAVIGRRLVFESGLYPNLFVCLVGPSGIGKSETMLALKEAAAKTIGDKDSGLFCADLFSAETLWDQFGACSQKMMVIPELSEWLTVNENSYKNQALKGWIKMYDMHHYSRSKPFVVHFRRGKATIEDPALSILAACTPHQLETTQENLRGGLVGRFVFAVGRGYQSDFPWPKPMPAEMTAKLFALFKGVAMTPVRTSYQRMKFSANAEMLFSKAFHEHRAEEKKRGYSDEMMTYTSRWRARVIKFCMLFECLMAGRVWPLESSELLIGETAMIAALKLERAMFQSFVAAFEQQFVRSGSGSRDFKIQQRMLKFMEENASPEGIARSKLSLFIQEGLTVFENNLGALLEAGRIIERRSKTGGRGRPKTVYFLAVKPETNGEAKHADPIDSAAL